MTDVRAFTATELSRMRQTQESAMMDTCVILVYSSSTDAYNNPVATYTPGSPVDCGLEHKSPREVHGTAEVELIDARLRLPIDTTVKNTDRVGVTHRFGEALATPEVYDITGPVRRGPSGLVLDLLTCTEV